MLRSHTVCSPLEPPVVGFSAPKSQPCVGNTGSVSGVSGTNGADVADGMVVAGPMDGVAAAAANVGSRNGLDTPVNVSAGVAANVGSGNGVDIAVTPTACVAGDADGAKPVIDVDGMAGVAGVAGVSGAAIVAGLSGIAAAPGVAGLTSSPDCSPKPISTIPRRRVRRSQSHDQEPMGAGQLATQRREVLMPWSIMPLRKSMATRLAVLAAVKKML
ncbi:unnamed protein product [Closterium sp. NIES-64]|nr:unnamed protein product [Closterium sp. NIES-64]